MQEPIVLLLPSIFTLIYWTVRELGRTSALKALALSSLDSSCAGSWMTRGGGRMVSLRIMISRETNSCSNALSATKEIFPA